MIALIELTDVQGRSIYINPAQIAGVEPYDADNCKVLLTGGQTIQVQVSADKLAKALSNGKSVKIS